MREESRNKMVEREKPPENLFTVLMVIFCNLENKENNKRLNWKNVHGPLCYSADPGQIDTNSIKSQNGRKYHFSTCTSVQPGAGGRAGVGREEKKL